ncbi:hypothetical protein [Caulobacter sp. 1776]|uniref:hypothetical protein n=1 Tax=Caulobacter sp. 1776 TaxID=3156420 RepID=UPI00339925E4
MASLSTFELLLPFTSYLCALATCCLAVLKGDRSLRLAAAALLVAWALSPLISKGHRNGLDYPVTILDTHLTLILIWISMRWRRIWCAVLAALTMIVVIIPIVATFDREIHIYNHAVSNNIVSDLQLVVVLVAVWLTVRARRRADEGAAPS